MQRVQLLAAKADFAAAHAALKAGDLERCVSSLTAAITLSSNNESLRLEIGRAHV